jgi:hypothetical protein
LHERVALSAGRPVSEVAADFRAGRALDAAEALRYRLVDDIAGDELPIRSIGSTRRRSVHGRRPDTSEPLGFRPRPRHP